MGMLHYRADEVTLESLVTMASAIAVVHPAAPAERIEELTFGGGEGAGPRPPAVRWARVWERVVVDEWLRPPLGATPPLIEIDAPGNESSAREAHDAANGLSGHIHHVVMAPLLVGVPEAWRSVDRRGPRIVLLSPAAMSPASIRFVECRRGLGLPVEARAQVAALLPRPAPPPRRRWPAAVVVGALAAATALAAWLARR